MPEVTTLSRMKVGILLVRRRKARPVKPGGFREYSRNSVPWTWVNSLELTSGAPRLL